MGPRITVGLFLVSLACAHPEDRALTPPLPRFEAAPPPQPPVIRVGLDVSLRSAADVIAGVRAWEAATVGWRRWELVPIAQAHARIVEIVDPAGPCTLPGYPIGGCSAQIGGLELEHDPWAKIYLVRGNYEEAATLITMHEIGHALGLSHQDGTLMAAHPDTVLWEARWDCPDAVTLLRLEWHTGWHFAQRCEYSPRE